MTAKKAGPRPKAAVRPKAPAPPTQGPTRRSGRGALVALGIAAVVVVVAVIAVLVTRSDDSGTAASTPQTYPVRVTGTPLPNLPNSGADPATGKVVPTLTGQSLFDGTPLTIAPGGQPQLVVFVAHWCPHCQREVPVLVRWMASAQKPANLQVVAVSTAYNESSVNEPASAWLQRENWPTPVLADSDDDAAGSAYGLTAFPYLVVVGPDGTVKDRNSGEMTTDELTKFVTDALAG